MSESDEGSDEVQPRIVTRRLRRGDDEDAIDTSGAVFSDTQIQENALAGNTQSVYVDPTTALSPGSVTLAGNIGYDPVGLGMGPSMTCGVSLINPFPTREQIYIVDPFAGIKKQGSPAYGAGTSTVLVLGVNESIEIDCGAHMPLPARYWYGA